MPAFQYEDLVSKTIAPETRKALAAQLLKDIDEFCIKEFTDEHRHHLGASIIGEECRRQIWYSWRWVKFKMFSGRMLRLFNRGHLEEARFIRWLKGIGCQVWDVDPASGKQFRIWGVSGHFGGSADSVGIIPYFPDLPMLLEFKTHATKPFSKVVEKGVVVAKPEHYSQMCAYGKHYGFRYGMYVAVNKNDDDLHIEIVELNWNMAHSDVNKAQDIILSQTPPNRISDNPAYFDCKYCEYSGICHNNEPVEINCRSCKYAKPVENAEWHCGRFNSIIPKDYIAKGCGDHVSINI